MRGPLHTRDLIHGHRIRYDLCGDAGTRGDGRALDHLHFQRASGEGEPPYLAVFRKWSPKSKLANMRSLGSGDLFEVTFYVELKDAARRNDLVRELNRVPSVTDVRIYVDSM